MKCELVKAQVWNETALEIGWFVREHVTKALNKGRFVSLQPDDLLLHVWEDPYFEPFAYSEKCFMEHTGEMDFIENPTLP